MAALGSTGTLVYLQVPAAELKRRLTNITTRGVAMRPGCTLEDVLAERLPLYRQYGQVTVDCAGRDPESCVAELAAGWDNSPERKKPEAKPPVFC